MNKNEIKQWEQDSCALILSHLSQQAVGRRCTFIRDITEGFQGLRVHPRRSVSL